MERLTTNSETHGTCLTLCYQSLPGGVTHLGVEGHGAGTVTQMALEAGSPVSMAPLSNEGSSSGGVGSLGLEGSTLGVDSQAAVAVQSLLDSQQPQDTTVEEEDVFQCGRCKKQFTSLNAFFTHKQTQCAPPVTATLPPLHLTPLDDTPAQLVSQQHPQTLQTMQPLQQSLQPMQNMGHVQASSVKTPLQVIPASQTSSLANTICAITQAGQTLATYTTLPTSPLSHIPQGMVLTDDLMTFTTNLDPATLQGSAIQMVAAPFNARSTGGVTILSTVQPTTTFAPQTSAPFPPQPQAPMASFTPQPPAPQLPPFPMVQSAPAALPSLSQPTVVSSVQPAVSQPAVEAAAFSLPPDKQAPAIIRRTPTKAGRKASKAAATGAGVERGGASGGRRGGRAAGGGSSEDKRRTLQCQYCNKLFAKNFDLQQHLRAHTGEKPFQCIVCGRAFAQKSNVKKHMATHKVWPSGTSSTLPKQPLHMSMDEDEVEEVEATETEEEGVIISVPDQPAKDDSSDKSNPQTSPGSQGVKVRVVVDNSYICQYCSTKFKTFFQLKTHMIQHKSEQVYKCVMKKCGQSFKELESFLEHTKTHESEMSYRCHQCNKYFPSLYDLGCHQYSHNLFPAQGVKSGPRHFQCTKCGNKYTTPEALEHHLATTSHQYPCPNCDKIFTCERFLRRHLPIHGSEGQFECPTCQKRFKTEHYLKSHLLIHTGETPYQCDTCHAAFNRKDKLKRHMTIHEAVKKYRCPFKSLTGCPKEFNRPDKLKSHIITHSGLKPFKCSLCGKGFSRRPHMLEHERGHKSDYRFKCDKCGRGFFRSKLFTEHKCQPGRGIEPQLFRPRRRRKIGRPRKREFVMTQESLLTTEVMGSESAGSEVTGSEVKRRGHGTPGLRSASGIHLQNSRVAAAIASQMKGNSRSRSAKLSAVEIVSEHRLSADKEGGLEEQGETTTATQLAQLAPLSDKQLMMQMLPGELERSQVIDHYVVQLTDCGDGGVPTLHTSLTPASLQAGLTSGTLQPITIIEATPLHMTGAEQGMMEAGLPVVTVSRGGEVMATQVMVASSSPGQGQFVPVGAQLVDFGAGDPVLQGTESLLKASAEILQTAHAQTGTL